MAALTGDRDTKARSGHRRSFPVKANAVIYAGAMVAIGADDLAVPMATATTLRGVGRAERRADNTGGADGDIRVEVGGEIYRYANSAAGDLITLADIGEPCYGVDDQTVALTDGTGARSVAGAIYDVDAQGVWVAFS